MVRPPGQDGTNWSAPMTLGEYILELKLLLEALEKRTDELELRLERVEQQLPRPKAKAVSHS
jgi:hypothetical protein